MFRSNDKIICKPGMSDRPGHLYENTIYTVRRPTIDGYVWLKEIGPHIIGWDVDRFIPSDGRPELLSYKDRLWQQERDRFRQYRFETISDSEVLDILNDYQGEHIWQDVILKFRGYSEKETVAIDHDSNVNDIAVINHTVFRFEPKLNEWIMPDAPKYDGG